MYINVELLQGDYCNEKGISYYSLIFPMFQTQDMKYTGDFCNEKGICYAPSMSMLHLSHTLLCNGVLYLCLCLFECI